MEIYFPREDSEMLAKHVSRYAKGLVLDMGTGTGIQALKAALKAKVIAVDINGAAIQYCKKHCNKDIEFRKSDLFENVKEKFDLIVFNPPYLPNDEDVSDIALDGGKEGHELIERFLKEAKHYLKEGGKILLLFSSLTGDVEKILKDKGYTYSQIDALKLDFEELYVYLVENGTLQQRRAPQEHIEKLSLC